MFPVASQLGDTTEDGLRDVRRVSAVDRRGQQQLSRTRRVQPGDALVGNDGVRMSRDLDHADEMAPVHVRRRHKRAAGLRVRLNDLFESVQPARDTLVIAFVAGLTGRYASTKTITMFIAIIIVAVY